MKCARREEICEKYEKKERNKGAGGGREWLSGDLREESASVEMVERRGGWQNHGENDTRG